MRRKKIIEILSLGIITALLFSIFTCSDEKKGKGHAGRNTPANDSDAEEETPEVAVETSKTEVSTESPAPPDPSPPEPEPLAERKAPCEGLADDTCRFDTRTFHVADNQLIESITVGPHIFTNTIGVANSIEGKKLVDIPRYLEHICKDIAADQCKFETREIIVEPDLTMESISAFGKFYNFNAADDSLISSGDLHSVPRYAADTGPCAAAYTENHTRPCVFDSRAIFDLMDDRVESITAYGRHFNWWLRDTGPEAWTSNGGDLSLVDRYINNGPCTGQGEFQCVIRTRAVPIVNGQKLEAMTAYGKYFDFRVEIGGALDHNGSTLSSVDRFNPPPPPE